jgi:hypothetical protein
MGYALIQHREKASRYSVMNGIRHFQPLSRGITPLETMKYGKQIVFRDVSKQSSENTPYGGIVLTC